jgi:hypothetical protein
MKLLFVPFSGEELCVMHVFLNVLDAADRGHTAGVVFEGASTKLVPEYAAPGNPFHGLYAKAKARGLILGACKACSNKMGVLDAVQAEGLGLLGEMSGHPSLARYAAEGYSIITV